MIAKVVIYLAVMFLALIKEIFKKYKKK